MRPALLTSTSRSAGKAIFVLRNRRVDVYFATFRLLAIRKSARKGLPWNPQNRRLRTPQPQGLYHPRNEHDACGMGLVANIRGEKSHEIIRKGLEVLINLTHRGAAGCDPETGDGAGILIQIPHAFFVRECAELGMKLPEPGAYGVAMCFLPVEKHSRLQCEGVFERIAQEEGCTVLGWRDTPVNGDAIGREARSSQPYIEQLFVGRPEGSGRRRLRAPALSRSPPHRKRDLPPRTSRTRRPSTSPRSPAAPSSTRA